MIAALHLGWETNSSLWVDAHRIQIVNVDAEERGDHQLDRTTELDGTVRIGLSGILWKTEQGREVLHRRARPSGLAQRPLHRRRTLAHRRAAIRIEPMRPDAAQVQLAERILEEVPGSEELLYARIDLVDDGTEPPSWWRSNSPNPSGFSLFPLQLRPAWRTRSAPAWPRADCRDAMRDRGDEMCIRPGERS
jgi:hypothetical protein